MASHSAMILVLFVGFFLCFQSTNGYKFFVGGKDGWVVHPSEDYSHWSQRNRFNVNDTLYFKYKKGEDSVLEVTNEQFNVCNTTGPLLKMEDGSSEVKLARSGPFYFISGVKENCDKGQKLLVVVISEHHRRPQAPSPSPLPSPSSPSPAPPKTSPSPSPVSSPPPASPPPHSAPSHSPTAPAPASPSPAPVSPSPKVSPSPAPTYPSPKGSPSPAPTSPSPKVSPSTAPTSPSPKVSPSPAPTSPSPEVPAPTPEASAPAADQGSPAPAPAPSKNAGAKILMALPVTGALMACSIALF